ncbi:MAG: ABC transporter substrate-binding protein [Chloroflexota bacterium]
MEHLPVSGQTQLSARVRLRAVSRRGFLKAAAFTAATTALGTVGLSVSGCSSAAPTAASRDVLLWTFLDPKATSARSLVQNSIVERATSKYGIKVDVQLIPWQTMNEQLIQAVEAGKGPDVAFSPGDWMTQDVVAGVLTPVTQFVNKWPQSTKDDFTPSLDFFTWDGKVMALPFLNFFTLLAYRQDFYAEKNLKPPTTWDELGRNARDLTTANRSGIVIALTPSENAAILMKAFIPMLQGAGGTLFGDKESAAFNSPAGVQVLQFWSDLAYEYKALPLSCLTMNAETQTQTLASGTTAMAPEGNHRIPTARAGAGVGKNLAGMPLPGPKSGSCPAYIANTVVMMGKNVHNPEAAWGLMEEFVSVESLLDDAKRAGQAATRKSVLADPYFSSPEGKEMATWSKYMVDQPYTFKWPLKFPILSTIIANAAQDVIGKKAPIKERLDQAAAEWNKENSKS